MGIVEQGARFMHMGERAYKFLSCFMVLMVLGFGIACCGPGGGGGDGDSEGASPGGGLVCDEAAGVTQLTGTDGTASLTDPMTEQSFRVTVSDNSGNPLNGMGVLLFSNGEDYFILAFDPGGFYGINSSSGNLVSVPTSAEPIDVSLVVEPIPVGTKLLSFPSTPPNLVDRRWCGIGSFSEACWTAEQVAGRFGLTLFFAPEDDEIWLALAQAISENFVENGIVSSFTGATTFTTFTIAGFPPVVVIGDSCSPGDVTSDDIRISLWWDNNADIDLHVIDPNGEEIYWAHTMSASGGELDFDAMCLSFPEGSRGGPEHITWAAGEAIAGEYTVDVNYFSECFGEGQTRYSMTIYVSGSLIFETMDAIINPADGRIFVTNFTF